MPNVAEGGRTFPVRFARAGNVQRDDDIHFQPDQLGRKVGKLIQLSFGRSKLKCNVLSFHIAGREAAGRHSCVNEGNSIS
jgi:hypothetical protein